MHFKILAAAMLILVGIAVFSVYSGSSNEDIQDDNDIIQKIEVNNSNFLEFSKDWDGFETVTIDIDKLRKAADSGHVILRLMGEEYEVKIQEASKNTETEYFYTGPVVGNNESKADLYLQENSFCGSVGLGKPRNVTYNIRPTDEKYNGETVYIVFMQGWEKEKQRLEKMEIDPLQFFLINNDSKKHVMSIEIFDFNNKSVFKENYTMDPEEQISSPKINAELGQYRHEIILDNKFTFEQKIKADYAADVNSSEILYIYVSDDPENPVTLGIAVA